MFCWAYLKLILTLCLQNCFIHRSKQKGILMLSFNRIKIFYDQENKTKVD